MRSFYFFSLYSAIFIVLFTACNQPEVKPSSSGKPGELIIVIDSSLWKTQPGQIIRDSLTAAFPAIPQYEPLFKLIQVQPEDFKNILQLHRNVFMVETGPVQEGRNYLLTYKNNVWASPQLVLNLRAVNATHLESALLSVIPTIVSRFMDVELNRLIDANSSVIETETGRELRNLMGVSMPLTEDFFIAKNQPNYLWIRKETVHSSFGFQFSRIPYASDSMFSSATIIAIRDSISKLHIPGPTAGSYMMTDINYPVSYAAVSVDSSYSVEVRGLWKTYNDFMGGPFISYLIHDKMKNELIFVDAFIYAPKFNKREYVKQMDAMVKSIKF